MDWSLKIIVAQSFLIFILALLLSFRSFSKYNGNGIRKN